MCETCPAERDLAHSAPAYRRALAVVVALNLGMGVVEIVGGWLAKSQGLKADALDFFGDGFITLLGLLAIRWGRRWRGRAALLQGGFLGVLALGVVGAAIYRAFARVMPEAEAMGVIGGLAFAANVAAALILVRHRTGDANVRAVWLFSRNDAIGNLAVIAAGGLVAWTGTAWPDLIVAVLIAGLFLHSSIQILRESVAELRELRAAEVGATNHSRDTDEPVVSPGGAAPEG